MFELLEDQEKRLLRAEPLLFLRRTPRRLALIDRRRAPLALYFIWCCISLGPGTLMLVPFLYDDLIAHDFRSAALSVVVGCVSLIVFGLTAWQARTTTWSITGDQLTIEQRFLVSLWSRRIFRGEAVLRFTPRIGLSFDPNVDGYLEIIRNGRTCAAMQDIERHLADDLMSALTAYDDTPNVSRTVTWDTKDIHGTDQTSPYQRDG